MNTGRIRAVARKDIGEIVVNPAVVVPMAVVPVVLCVVVPLAMTILALRVDISLVQGAELIERILPLYAVPDALETTNARILYVFLNYTFLPLFMLVPLMVSSIIAANSVVGEKERGTLETLLYTPLTNRELLAGKLASAFVPAVVLAVVSAGLFAVSVTVSARSIAGIGLLRADLWILAVLVLSPAVSLLGLAVTVLVSVKAKSFMAAQQIAGILVVPLIALVVVQMTGVIVVDMRFVVIAAVVVSAAGLLILLRVAPRFSREEIVSRL